MKPFDPKTAKNGDVLCFKSNGHRYKYVGAYPFNPATHSVVMDENANLLFVSNEYIKQAPTKRTVWINVYPDGKAVWWDDKDDALTFADKDNLVDTYPLEIEE